MRESDKEWGVKYYSLNDVLTFGKYKSKTVGWVCENDPQYIIWVNENVSNFKIENTVVVNCRLDICLHHDNDSYGEDGPDCGDGIEWLYL